MEDDEIRMIELLARAGYRLAPEHVIAIVRELRRERTARRRLLALLDERPG